MMLHTCSTGVRVCISYKHVCLAESYAHKLDLPTLITGSTDLKIPLTPVRFLYSRGSDGDLVVEVRQSAIIVHQWSWCQTSNGLCLGVLAAAQGVHSSQSPYGPICIYKHFSINENVWQKTDGHCMCLLIMFYLTSIWLIHTVISKKTESSTQAEEATLSAE